MLSLGSFPAVLLADARAKRDEAQKLLANGINPSDQKKQDKLVAEAAGRNSFGALAAEHLDNMAANGLAETTLVIARFIILERKANARGAR